MLESRSLLLRKATASSRGAGPRLIPIRDGATGAALGLAREEARHGWLAWLASRVLEVCEGEDLSLVCTLHRGWGRPPAWEVCDAEGNHVGGLIDARRGWLGCCVGRGSGLRIFDRDRACLAEFDRQRQRFLSPAGVELASAASTPDGTTLTFSAAVEDDPFAKMLLVAAVLAQS